MNLALPRLVENWTDDRVDGGYRLSTEVMQRTLAEIVRSLRDHPEEPVVVSGPTGYGKSVLLRALRDHPPRGYTPRLLPFAHVDLEDLESYVVAWLTDSTRPSPMGSCDPDLGSLFERDASWWRPTLLLLDELQATPYDSLRRLWELCAKHRAAFVGAALAGPTLEGLLTGQPRTPRRISLDVGWNRQDALRLIERLAAGTGVSSERLKASVDLDSLLTRTAGSPRLMRTGIAARLRRLDWRAPPSVGPASPSSQITASPQPPAPSREDVGATPSPVDPPRVTPSSPTSDSSLRRKSRRSGAETTLPTLATHGGNTPRAGAVAVSRRAPATVGRSSVARAWMARASTGLASGAASGIRRVARRTAALRRAAGRALHVGRERSTVALERVRAGLGRSLVRSAAALRSAGVRNRLRLGDACRCLAEGVAVRIAAVCRTASSWTRLVRQRVHRHIAMYRQSLRFAGLLAGAAAAGLAALLLATTLGLPLDRPLPAERFAAIAVPQAGAPVGVGLPPAEAMLSINALPWALVELDGQPAGSTPLRLAVAAGPHHLRVQMSNGRVYEQGIDVPETGHSIAFR